MRLRRKIEVPTEIQAESLAKYDANLEAKVVAKPETEVGARGMAVY